MPSLCIAENSPYAVAEIYSLVVDVAKYPEFLPWCNAARVTRVSETELLGELVISFKSFTERYTSRITLIPQQSPEETAEVHVVMVEGPFHHLTNRWRLIPQPEGGTLIQLDLDFRFKSKLLESLIGGLFQRASEKMVSAFRTRADALYGNKTAT
jgi:coenzyme Q-binding protein COQ10